MPHEALLHRQLATSTLSALSPDVVTEVRDILINPPADNPYDTLKTELVKRTAASAQRKLQQLLGGEELGDRKPTQLLRRMQQLLGAEGATVHESFIRELFLQRLPANVRMVLASADAATELGKLAEMADKVMEVVGPTVAAVTKPPPPQPQQLPPQQPPPSGTEFQQLRQEVARLTSLVESLSTHPNSNRRNSFKRRPRSPSPAAPSSSSLCWYHHTFGEDAKRCKPPCTWTSNTQAGN